VTATKQRAVRPGVHLELRCACGGTLRGAVSPATAAIQLRDIFLLFHREDGCVVTDTSKDTP
jgi:hypothetical protein